MRCRYESAERETMALSRQLSDAKTENDNLRGEIDAIVSCIFRICVDFVDFAWIYNYCRFRFLVELSWI